MTRRPATPAAAGFTLIEVLIALSIFAMLSTAGVMLLRSTITTQASVSRQLRGSGEIIRVRALVAGALLSAQPRANRDEGGAPRAALLGTADMMAVVHSSDGGIRSTETSVERSTYRVADGRLIRDGTSRIDGASADTPATLMRGITAATWRYRGSDGNWSDSWSPDRPDRLPRAVELTINRVGGSPVSMAFLVAPDGLPAPGSERAGTQQ